MTLEEILNLPLKMKNSGELLKPNLYTTSYPFDSSKGADELNIHITSSGSLLIYENFFFWYSGLIPLNHNTIEVIMNENGLIPIPWRYFIAIMAVSTIRCHYLLIKLQESFLLKGGDEDWLVYGLAKVPEKLQKLAKINNLLAHQPWKFCTKDITELFTTKNGWNRDELVHAALIMINYHRLASIVESLKISFVEIPTSKSLESSFSLDKEGKTNLYNNLVEMNEEDEAMSEVVNEKNANKKIDKNEGNLVDKIRNSQLDKEFVDSKIQEDKDRFKNTFDIYISDYCTLYLDFDVYSDNPISNMVRKI